VKIKRIYRTIPLGSFSERHIQPEGDEGNILWEATPEHMELIEQNKAQDSVGGAAITLPRWKNEIKRGFANKLLLDVFTNNVGRDLTPQEIASLIYPESQDSAKKLCNRVSAIMSSGRAYINQELASMGLSLEEKTELVVAPGS